MALEELPFVNWIFWAALTAGSLLVVGVTELLGGTTRGYRLFMAALLAVCAGILLLSSLISAFEVVLVGAIVVLLVVSLRNTWDLLVTVGEVTLGSGQDPN